jgi:hypothetical protein
MKTFGFWYWQYIVLFQVLGTTTEMNMLFLRKAQLLNFIRSDLENLCCRVHQERQESQAQLAWR